MQELISRQAAIDALNQIFDRCEEIEAHLPEGDPDRIGYKMFPDYMTVWEYLHQLPSAQPKAIRPKFVAEDRYIKNHFRIFPHCPKCNCELETGDCYCRECGCHIDWSEDDE